MIGFSAKVSAFQNLTKGSEKVSRAEMEQALLEQGAQGEKIMATIAQDYIQQGMQQGLRQGLQQGRLEEKRNIARQLLKLHGIVTVSEITGLSVAEVQALAASAAEPDKD
jgi:predicted transposase/invertase (TIGR01784 family)